MTQEALKLALECAERCEAIDGMYSWSATITAIKEALAQTQEPVAWTLADKVRQDLDRQSCPDAFMRIAVESIVKHHPPQRIWVGLTDEDKHEIELRAGITEDDDGYIVSQVFELTEAKLKELNT